MTDDVSVLAIVTHFSMTIDVLLSDEIKRILHLFLFVILYQAVTVFGICSNTNNILCFVKEGFQPLVNVSLLAIKMTEQVSELTVVNQFRITEGTQRNVLLSDEITRILHWFLFVIVCQAITVFGIFSNIINIVCFIKQGFQDPVNVSLLGLAVSDLGSLLSLMWTNVCYTPALVDADLPFDPFEIQYVTAAWVHIAFSRVTAWITAIITLERCLCITIPLKVKHIVTSKRMTIIIVVLFIALLSTLAPVYMVNRLGLKFFPKKNKTLIGNIVTDKREMIESITFPIINMLLPFTSFIVIMICTITLVFKLRANSRWRMTSSTTAQAVNISSRNIRVAKMVTMIAVLFISCFAPMSIIFLGMSFEPRLSFDGDYINTLSVLGAICMILESVNSASNILIYFYMSSKYKEVFLKLFSLKC